MTNIWSYVCEIDGAGKRCYYITKTDPDLLFRDRLKCWDSDEDCWWYEIDPNLKRVSINAEVDMDNLNTSAAALMLDLSNVPLPTETDSKPIVVIQKIDQSSTYYIEE